MGCFVYFSTDRVQHCLAKYVSPDHPEQTALEQMGQIAVATIPKVDQLPCLRQRARSEEWPLKSDVCGLYSLPVWVLVWLLV